MPHRKAKKPRGSRRVTPPCVRDRKQKAAHDLMVLLPKSSAATEVKIQAQLQMKQLIERLSSIGYTTMAFAHVVYGRPRTDDSVASLLPYPSERNQSMSDKPKQPAKRRKPNPSNTINILRRLHAVVENLSDVGVYSKTDATENAATLGLLKDYDLVSLAPKNEATFQAACLASEADIVTLDYTAGRGGIQLPFRIRPSDVRNVVQRDASFELLYSPALLHLNQRKALVQSARFLLIASVDVRPKPRLIVSSGDRTVTGDIDMGAMALRSPGDLINLLQTVLGLDTSVAYDALGASAASVLDRGRLRKLGYLESRELIDVFVDGDEREDDEGEKKEGKQSTTTSIKTSQTVIEEQEKARVDVVNDGFISF